jgi:hypothetical protein
MRSVIFDAVAVRDPLDKMNDVPTEHRVFDPRERFGERKPIRSGEEVAHEAQRRRRAFPDRRSWRPGRALEEERYRYLQDVRDVLEAARSNPVCALFVFLHLLECEAKGNREFLLAHFEHQPAHAHMAAHVHISRVR